MEKTQLQLDHEEDRNIVREAREEQTRGELRESYGIDIADKATFDFTNRRFSWKGLRESAVQLAAKTRESNSANTFGQLLRSGISSLANSWYNMVPVVHEQIVGTVVSNKAIELHAPLHRGAVPRRVQKHQPFPETKVRGLDIQIVNEKFGAIVGFERELFDDDQTGQIRDRAKDVGENMRILEAVWCATRFIGAAGSYSGDVIPASQTYATVWSTALDGGGSNKLPAYAAFSQPNLQALDIILMNQKDLLGNQLLVNPNTLYVGTDLKFAARALLNSEWYPSTTAMGVGGTGTSTGIGTSFARNVMEGLYNLVVDRFLPRKAYSIGEAGKGILLQRRDPLEFIQENPASGSAFQMDEYRFRARARWEPDWVDPRFWALGNDGTVS